MIRCSIWGILYHDIIRNGNQRLLLVLLKYIINSCMCKLMTLDPINWQSKSGNRVCTQLFWVFLTIDILKFQLILFPRATIYKCTSLFREWEKKKEVHKVTCTAFQTHATSISDIKYMYKPWIFWVCLRLMHLYNFPLNINMGRKVSYCK